MKMVKVEVKSKGKVVKTIKVTQFDNTAEAIAKLGGGKEGDEKATSLINRMIKTDESNKARRPATGPSLGKILKGESAETKTAINKMVVDFAKREENTALLEKLKEAGLME